MIYGEAYALLKKKNRNHINFGNLFKNECDPFTFKKVMKEMYQNKWKKVKVEMIFNWLFEAMRNYQFEMINFILDKAHVNLGLAVVKNVELWENPRLMH